MEGDHDHRIQELKHACKFCGKSFPCGRSLGGHMRSHITNLSSEMDNNEKEKLPTRKLSSSLNNNGGVNDSEAAGYGLRENPKKTWRISDNSSEDALVFDKFCRECGKGFLSWKALFGHMKCHSEKERVFNSLEDQDSWTNANKVVMDIQSDNEATAPNKRRRSKRRTRYTVASASATATVATSSVVSFANNPSNSSISEVEQEQEEVAMSLMMLSRDASPWSAPHSVAAESSDNNSAYFEARSSVRTNLVTKFDGKNKNFSARTAKLIKKSDKVGNSENPNSIRVRGKSSIKWEVAATITTEIPENEFRVNKSGVSNKGYEKANKSEIEYVSALEEDSEAEHGRSRVNETESATTGIKYSSIKTKFSGSELKSNKNWVDMDKALEAESSKNSHKRGKFECTTCNKIFHSYQALGGHRASHKRIKGCFASRNESSENSIETDLSPPDPITTTENNLMKNNSGREYPVEHQQHGSGFHNDVKIVVTESKKSKGHECPICLKVFSSGQALGGHKRSHMVGGSESRNFQTLVLQEPVAEIRDFLDLNLPAATTEEESNSHADSNRPWWVVEDNHKQEALIGLI